MSSRQRMVNTIGVCLVLCGCTYSTASLKLPTSGLSPNLTGGNGREVVVVVPFKDEREIRDRCGRKRHSMYGFETAKVLCAADPAQWIAQALANELGAAGFRVRTNPNPKDVANPGVVHIEGSLLKFFVELRNVKSMWEFEPANEVDIHTKLVLSSSSGLLAERSFYIKGRAPAKYYVYDFDAAIEDAARKAMKDMVVAILSLMNRYPQLGTTEPPMVREITALKGDGR